MAQGILGNLQALSICLARCRCKSVLLQSCGDPSNPARLRDERILQVAGLVILLALLGAMFTKETRALASKSTGNPDLRAPPLRGLPTRPVVFILFLWFMIVVSGCGTTGLQTKLTLL